jgi:PhnB protein
MPNSPTKSPGLLGGASSSITLYFPDCDGIYTQAVKAGAEVLMPMADMFWGDRYGTIRDPFGCVWSIATHKEDFTREEMQRRTQDFFANLANQPG